MNIHVWLNIHGSTQHTSGATDSEAERFIKLQASHTRYQTELITALHAEKLLKAKGSGT